MRKNVLPNPNDLLIAIRKKCLDCMGNHAKLVSECNSKECPLHSYRNADALLDISSVSREQIPGQLSLLP